MLLLFIFVELFTYMYDFVIIFIISTNRKVGIDFMPDLKTRWLVDTMIYQNPFFNDIFNYPVVIPNIDITSFDDLTILNSCISDSIKTKDDSEFIRLSFQLYEKCFGTKVYIPEPNGSKTLIFHIMNESYRVNCDYLSLYYKGVSLALLDKLSDDIIGNNANLANII